METGLRHHYRRVEVLFQLAGIVRVMHFHVPARRFGLVRVRIGLNELVIVRSGHTLRGQTSRPGMLALLHELVVSENVSNAESADGTSIISTQGKAAFETLARQSLGRFRVRQQSIRSLTLGDRTIAAEIKFDAVLAVDLPNGNAEPRKAGDSLHLRGVTVFGFTDGKIVRISDYM